jgi:hypothetical protein
MTETEKILFAAIPANEFNTYWVPCTWFIYRYLCREGFLFLPCNN